MEVESIVDWSNDEHGVGCEGTTRVGREDDNLEATANDVREILRRGS